MDIIPSKSHHRRVFYLISGLTLLVLTLIRFCVVPGVFGTQRPSAEAATVTLVDNLLATLVTTVGIAALLFWLTPPIMRRSSIQVIEPREIPKYLQEGRTNAREYWYRGGCGRFTRAVTIPALAQQARSSNMTKLVRIQILDPDNSEICRQYAEHRNKLRSGKANPWTQEGVREDLLATVVAGYMWKSDEPLVDVEIGVHTTFNLLRIDLSSKLAVITKEDPLEPALQCDEGSFFYDSFFEDLRLTYQQSRKLAKEINGPGAADLSADTVRSLVVSIGLRTPSDESIGRIIAKVRDADNPYG